MRPVVVDASVVVKWFVPEVRSLEAERLLDGTVDLLAPDLLVPEVGNILWKKFRRREITGHEAREILAAFARVPVGLVASTGLLAAAFEIAESSGRTVYDALYVALALAHGTHLVTADDRLARALGRGPLAPHVRALGAS